MCVTISGVLTLCHGLMAMFFTFLVLRKIMMCLIIDGILDSMKCGIQTYLRLM